VDRGTELGLLGPASEICNFLTTVHYLTGA